MKERAWEVEYKKYKDGKMDERIEELKNKFKNKTISKIEFDELKKMEKIKANINKVSNILELKKNLLKKDEEIKKEIKILTNSEKTIEEVNKVQNDLDKLEEELTELNIEKASLKIQQRGASDKEKVKLQQKIDDLNIKISENNAKFKKNQDYIISNKNIKNKKLMGLSEKELREKAFDIGTKVSKCNMAASNLMKGHSWDFIEMKLDNWKSRKYTSKDEAVQKARDIKKAEPNIEELTENIIKETQKQINNENKEKVNEEETSLVEVSEFAKKHPRLAKIGNWFKNKFAKTKENVVDKEANNKEEINTKKEVDFKEYLKKVAEKGIDEVKKEKLEKAKEMAHKRETEKFGKNYADKSYNVDDEQR